MTNHLAAAAAEIELSEWDIAETLGDAIEDAEPNPLAVRDALLTIARLEQEIDDVATVKAQIVDRYEASIASRKQRVDAIRESLLDYCKRHGKVSFPDVGGIHLTTRRAKARVVDGVAFQAWLETNGAQKIVEAATEIVSRFDAGRALDLYLDEVDAQVKPDGCIVDADGGIYELGGVEVCAESKTLAVRKS